MGLSVMRHLPFAPSATPLQAATYLLGISLFSISFLVFLNSSISFVITDRIGVKTGVGDIVGTLGFVDELVALVACPAWGLLSDRLGVRLVAVIGYVVIALALVLSVQATNVYPQLLLARILFAVGATAAATMVTAILPSLTDDSEPTPAAGHSDAETATTATAAAAALPDTLPKSPVRNPRDSAMSLESQLTITPERFAESQQRQRAAPTNSHDNEIAETAQKDGSGKPSKLAGFVGLFTGCGALVALVLFLPLPAQFGRKDGVTMADAVADSFYVVAAVSLCVGAFVFVGLRHLRGEDGKGWRMLLGLPTAATAAAAAAAAASKEVPRSSPSLSSSAATLANTPAAAALRPDRDGFVSIDAVLETQDGQDGQASGATTAAAEGVSESQSPSPSQPVAQPASQPPVHAGALPYWRLLRDSVRLGFTDSSIALGYLGGFVARASTVAISLFVPLFVNAFFIRNGFCQGSPHDSSPELKKECRAAYVLASMLTGVAQLMGLLCAPVFGYLSSRPGQRVNAPLVVATTFGIVGYIAFPLLASPEPRNVDGRGGSPAVFAVATLIGISQIGAIVCSLGSLGRGVLAAEKSAGAGASASASASAGASGSTSDSANSSYAEPNDDVDAPEGAPLLAAARDGDDEERCAAAVVPASAAPDSRIRLKGSIAGMYSWCGGAAILLLTKLGGYLFDRWSTGAPFYMMAVFNAVLLVASLSIDASRFFQGLRK